MSPPPGSQVAVLVPVLRRPHRVVPLMQSLMATMSVNYRLLFIPNPDDAPEIRAIQAAGGVIGALIAGNYATKINCMAKRTHEPYIFTGADDLKFHPRWFEAAVAKMTGKVGVVGTQDMCNPRVIRGEHATHFLVSRAYADLGTIDNTMHLMCQEYPHEFVDDEFAETAKARGAWAFAPDSVVEHLHPDVKKAPVDALYAAQAARMRAGRVVYQRRRHLWTST